MTRRWALALSALAILSVTACEEDFQEQTGVEGTDAFDRYVAIGTSISMGFQSGGVYYSGQANAWPALLADQAFASFQTPLIEAPGCSPPLIAPLQFFRRLDGSSLAAPAQVPCTSVVDDLAEDVPLNNVAIAGALTSEALNTTYESTLDPQDPADPGNPLYALVLGDTLTQVTAMQAQDPTLVSVELGANEVLGAATSGVVVPGVTFVPVQGWQPVYEDIIDSVRAENARVLLVTVPQVASIVSLRSGAELWAQRAQLQARGVILDADCGPGGAGEANVIFVPRKVLGAIAAASASGQAQALRCTDGTGAPAGAADYILTPADVATLTTTVDAMNAHIAGVAQANGWALVDANAVLGEILENAPAFDVADLLTCSLPYGQYISLDGVHPNNAGHQLVANAAAAALNAQYGFAIPQLSVTPIDACP